MDVRVVLEPLDQALLVVSPILVVVELGHGAVVSTAIL